MKADAREAILERVLALAKTVVGDNNAFRNLDNIPESVRPAITIFDADEAADQKAFGRARSTGGPIKVELSPEIIIVTSTEQDKAGPALSTLRTALLKAFFNDATLAALCCDDGLRYDGFATGFALGRHGEGDAVTHFTFTHMLHPLRL
jgi:hypothetical protein